MVEEGDQFMHLFRDSAETKIWKKLNYIKVSFSLCYFMQCDGSGKRIQKICIIYLDTNFFPFTLIQIKIKSEISIRINKFWFRQTDFIYWILGWSVEFFLIGLQRPSL